MNLLKYFLRTTQFYLFIILTNLFFSNNRDLIISGLITLLLLSIGVSHPEGRCILFPGNSDLDLEGPWSL